MMVTSLAHQAFLAHLKSGIPVDYNDPLIQDQLFSVRMTRKNHMDQLRRLRGEIAAKKAQASKQGNFKTIPTVQGCDVHHVFARLLREYPGTSQVHHRQDRRRNFGAVV